MACHLVNIRSFVGRRIRTGGQVGEQIGEWSELSHYRERIKSVNQNRLSFVQQDIDSTNHVLAPASIIYASRDI